MYYKTRRVTLKKDGTLRVCAAESNVRPLRYFTETYHYSEDSEENVKHFLVSTMEGNFEISKGCKIRPLIDSMMELTLAAEHTSFSADFMYRVKRLRGLYELIVNEYGYPRFMGKDADYTSVVCKIQAYDAESKRVYDNVQADYDAKHLIHIESASLCAFPGVDILITGDDVYIAKQENYDNMGLLDLSDGTTVKIVSDEPLRLFNSLRFSHKPGEFDDEWTILIDFANKYAA